MTRTQRAVFARDAAVATAILGGLFLLGYGVQFQPLQIPTYLLVVGFDVLEVVFGSAGANYDLLFGAYLVGLGVLAAGVAHVLRTTLRATDRPQWRLAVSGAMAILGSISLLFAANVLVSTTRRTPVFVTGVAGLALLALAAWSAGVLRIEFGSPRSPQ